MGYALYQTGDYKGCRKALEDALKVSGAGALPGSLRADARLRMADCDNYLGNVKAALAAYQEAASDTEGGSPDYAALQAACMKGILGDEAGKKLALEAMMQKWPSSPWSQQALYELSQACLATGDFKGAEQAQERLEKLAPGSQMLRESKLQTAARLCRDRSRGGGRRRTSAHKDMAIERPGSIGLGISSDILFRQGRTLRLPRFPGLWYPRAAAGGLRDGPAGICQRHLHRGKASQCASTA